MMDWNWKLYAVIPAGMLVFCLTAAGFHFVLKGGLFSDRPVSEWEISEAIFYGSALIAFAIFVRSG